MDLNEAEQEMIAAWEGQGEGKPVQPTSNEERAGSAATLEGIEEGEVEETQQGGEGEDIRPGSQEEDHGTDMQQQPEQQRESNPTFIRGTTPCMAFERGSLSPDFPTAMSMESKGFSSLTHFILNAKSRVAGLKAWQLLLEQTVERAAVEKLRGGLEQALNEVAGFQQKWDRVQLPLVCLGTYIKIRQNTELRRALRIIPQALLLYCGGEDGTLGTNIRSNEIAETATRQWGRNHIGLALSAVKKLISDEDDFRRVLGTYLSLLEGGEEQHLTDLERNLGNAMNHISLIHELAEQEALETIFNGVLMLPAQGGGGQQQQEPATNPDGLEEGEVGEKNEQRELEDTDIRPVQQDEQAVDPALVDFVQRAIAPDFPTVINMETKEFSSLTHFVLHAKSRVAGLGAAQQLLEQSATMTDVQAVRLALEEALKEAEGFQQKWEVVRVPIYCLGSYLKVKQNAKLRKGLATIPLSRLTIPDDMPGAILIVIQWLLQYKDNFDTTLAEYQSSERSLNNEKKEECRFMSFISNFHEMTEARALEDLYSGVLKLLGNERIFLNDRAAETDEPLVIDSYFEWVPPASEETENDNPAYFISSPQGDKAVGVLLNGDLFPDMPTYVAFGNERGEFSKALMAPSTARYEVGQVWQIEKQEGLGWDWRRETDYYRLEGEEKTASYKAVGEAGPDRNGIRAILFEGSINYQAVARNPVCIKQPKKVEVAAKLMKKEHKHFSFTGAGLAKSARIEFWNRLHRRDEPKPGELWLLIANRLPTGAHVGSRYAFPPPAKWTPTTNCETVGAGACFPLYLDRRLHDQDVPRGVERPHTSMKEMDCLTNIKAVVEEEELDAAKFSFVALVTLRDQGEMEATVTGTNSSQLQGLRRRWKAGEHFVVAKCSDSPAIARGNVEEQKEELELGNNNIVTKWSFTMKGWLHKVTDELNEAVAEHKKLLLTIPADTSTLSTVQEIFENKRIWKLAKERSARGRIIRILMRVVKDGELEQQAHPCQVNHITAVEEFLSEQQRRAANYYCCDCPRPEGEGKVGASIAGFGTGKTHTAVHTHAVLVEQKPEVQIASLFSMNAPMLEAAERTKKLLQRLGVKKEVVVILSRRAQKKHYKEICQRRLQSDVVTLAVNTKGRRRYVMRQDVIDAVETKKPAVIFATVDKAILLAAALHRVTYVTIDEAGRVPMASSLALITLLPSLRTIQFLGDPNQLGIYEERFPDGVKARPTGFVSPLEELMRGQGALIAYYEHSYRMHPVMSRLITAALYRHTIHAMANVGDKSKLVMWPHFNLPKRGFPVVLLHNEAQHQTLPGGTSVYNMAEIDLMTTIFEALNLFSQYRQKTSFVFECFYEAAKIKMKQHLRHRGHNVGDEHFKTVDEFQGGERDLVFLLTSRTGGEMAHVTNDKRVTTAWTRASHGLVVVGNFRELTADKNRVVSQVIANLATSTPIVDSSYVMSGEGMTCANPKWCGNYLEVDNRLPVASCGPVNNTAHQAQVERTRAMSG